MVTFRREQGGSWSPSLKKGFKNLVARIKISLVFGRQMVYLWGPIRQRKKKCQTEKRTRLKKKGERKNHPERSQPQAPDQKTITCPGGSGKKKQKCAVREKPSPQKEGEKWESRMEIFCRPSKTPCLPKGNVYNSLKTILPERNCPKIHQSGRRKALFLQGRKT